MTAASLHGNDVSFHAFSPSIPPFIHPKSGFPEIQVSLSVPLIKVHRKPLITRFWLRITDFVDAVTSTPDPLRGRVGVGRCAHAPTQGTRMGKRSKGSSLSRFPPSPGKCCVSETALNRTRGQGSWRSGLRRVSEISPACAISQKARIVRCRRARIKVSGRTSRP